MKISKMAELFMKVFAGLPRAHGVYDLRNPITTPEGKVKGKATTKLEAYSHKHWEDHLLGKMGLGIVPIRDDGTLVFAAIDIDDYKLDLSHILKRCAEIKLIPVLSKSGGVHAYAFFKSPVPASPVRKKFSSLRSELGYAKAEIFPKQDNLIHKDNDVGNWLNMPYYDFDKSHRIACDYQGNELSAEEFLKFVEANKLELTEFLTSSLSKETNESEEHVPDGPPCLQHLTQHGFPSGSRNNGLFNMAVYYRKAYPDDWERKVEEANRRWMTPGTAEEVSAIIRSVRRKTYAYKCQERPICDHCNKEACKTRKYGVGQARELPVFADLMKIMTEPPMYFLTIEGTRVGPVTSEILLTQQKLAQVCLDQANLILMRMKPDEFQDILGKLAEEVNEIEMPEDSKDSGILLEHLIAFVRGPRATENKKELVIGKVWVDGTTHIFRLKDFSDYLYRVNFKSYKVNQLTTILREKGLTTKSIRIDTEVFGAWVFEFSEEAATVPVSRSIESGV